MRDGGDALAAPRYAWKGRSEHGCNFPQFGAGASDGLRGLVLADGLGGRVGGSRAVAAMALLQALARAGQRVSLIVNQALDFERHFYVAPAVKALAGSAFAGPKLRELRFPEAQYVGFHSADAGNVPYFEVEAIGNRGRFNNNALAGKLWGHGCRGERA